MYKMGQNWYIEKKRKMFDANDWELIVDLTCRSIEPYHHENWQAYCKY